MEKISTCLLLFPLLIHENSFAEHSGKSSNQREVASSRVRPQIELHSRLFVSNGDCSMTIVRDPKASFYEGKKWRDACLFSRNWTTATGTTWPLWPACSNFLPLKLNEEVHTSRQLVRKLKFLATIWHYHVCWGYANFAKICSLLYLLLLKTSPQWVQTLICLLAFLPHFARSEHFSLIQSTLSIWKFFQGSLKQNIVPCKSIKSHYLIHHNRFIFWIGGTLEAMTRLVVHMILSVEQMKESCAERISHWKWIYRENFRQCYRESLHPSRQLSLCGVNELSFQQRTWSNLQFCYNHWCSIQNLWM